MNTITIAGTGRTVAVGKILCVGRNYAEHAREMKAEVPQRPVLFLKPATALLRDGGTVVIPAISSDLHHEVEMVVLLGTGGKNIPRDRAAGHVAGYAVGLDMTLRDVQAEAKKGGLPWAVAKGFDTSAPVSSFRPAEQVPDPHSLAISLAVNGETRQRGTTADMIFSVPDLIAYISTLFTLEPGDLLFTGTPEGVGPARPGDTLHASLEGVAELTVLVGR